MYIARGGSRFWQSEASLACIMSFFVCAECETWVTCHVIGIWAGNDRVTSAFLPLWSLDDPVFRPGVFIFDIYYCLPILNADHQPCRRRNPPPSQSLKLFYTREYAAPFYLRPESPADVSSWPTSVWSTVPQLCLIEKGYSEDEYVIKQVDISEYQG